MNKDTCPILINLLVRHGVERCVLSPGSRDVPLIIAAARDPRLRCEVVIDERVAAFMALGMASVSRRPVALICTSGTAMLNYAPAVAEAFYRHVPLIVISADRPPQWIDQDDSQTIRQPGALTNIVKRSYNLRAECGDHSDRWWVNREINDAMSFALEQPRGPVHINISIDEPLTRKSDVAAGSADIALPHDPIASRAISALSPSGQLTPSEARWIAAELADKRVMIVAGFGDPDEKLNRAMSRLAQLPNVIILTESISNIKARGVIQRIDSTLSVMSDAQQEALRPDVVITTGGALISRMIKKYLRSASADRSLSTQHWYVGESDRTIDCFQHLTRRVKMNPAQFFSQLASAMGSGRDRTSLYRDSWLQIAERARSTHEAYIIAQPWSDLVATKMIFDSIPRLWNVQLSNGTSVRYGQLMADGQGARVDANRGVSGIDGSTATAIGASLISDAPTLLLTGDMSMQYDLGALATKQLSPKMKIIALCNGGGAIFRFIEATRHVPELDQYLSVGVNLPLRALCDAFHIAFYPVNNADDMRRQFPLFASQRECPALMAVYTDGEISADVLTRYFRRAYADN